MFSTLTHLVVLGYEVKTHEIDDNGTQHTMSAKLNDTDWTYQTN